MSPLFGPILAQIVTLGVSDGTEARYIATAADSHFEASTSPRVGLGVGWKHSSVTLAYGPSITVVPLESTPRDTLIFHNASLSYGYRWQRTTLSVSENVGVGEVNFQTLALSDPGTTNAMPASGSQPGGTPTPPPGGTNGTPGTGNTPGTGTNGGTTTGNGATIAKQVPGVTIPFVTATTSVDVSHRLSRIFSLSEGVAYLYSGGMGGDAASKYPVTRGVRAIVSGTYRLGHRDSLSTSVSTGVVVVTGDNLWVTQANESWSHTLDPHTGTVLGTGLSISRTAQSDGLTTWSIYPNFLAGISHSSRLWRGTLTLSWTASAAPAIDPFHASVDPRLGTGLGAAWSKKRFSATATTSSAISLTSDAANAFRGVSAALTLGYWLGAGFSTSTGVRASWQSFGGESTVPPAYSIFLGLGWGAAVPLAGGK